ncbi:hypothetical protein CEXT_730031 [Caerostris extrusa]|uniref:Uncharacterized protein n=1 Tax=Caerostris extrusa TaxID=172846 RepID=A0AAV4R1L6_CAEEX|nr:hypothetical protein CEXT_730031 [Caerostris extrusa]
MEFKSGIYDKPLHQTSLNAFDLFDLNIMYVFMLGDKSTGKTILIDSLRTRCISDPLLPSFQHVSESDRMTDVGMITLRLLELNREQLSLPEISQVCQAAKHVFLFVYAFDDLDSLRCLYTRWIMHVKNIFGCTITTVMLGNKIDLVHVPGFKVKYPVCSNSLAHGYKALFKVNYVFQCSALNGYQLELVLLVIAVLGNKHHCHQKLA